MSIEENKCDITGNFYSDVRTCTKCGRRYAAHQGSEGICRLCIKVMEKQETSITIRRFAPGIYIVMFLLVCLIPVIGGSYDWIRPSAGNGTNLYSNTTVIYNFTNYTYITVNNYTNNSFLANESYLTNISLISGDGIRIITKGNNLTVNATLQSIQTFPGSHFTDKDGASGQFWQVKTYNSTATDTVAVNSIYDYNFELNELNESFGYWDIPYRQLGRDQPFNYVSVGIPFRQARGANKVNIYARVKGSSGSIIGNGCPYQTSDPNTTMQNISIVLNRPYTTPSMITLNWNTSMMNWTTIALYNASLLVLAPSSNPDTLNWRASVVTRQKTNPTLAVQQSCFLLESITIEQYETNSTK